MLRNEFTKAVAVCMIAVSLINTAYAQTVQCTAQNVRADTNYTATHGWHNWYVSTPPGSPTSGYTAQSSVIWDCSVGDIEGCALCYSPKLYKDTTWNGDPSSTPTWQLDSQTPTRADQGVVQGACGVGGMWNFTWVVTGLPPGRYKLYVEYGAPAGARCYILYSHWIIFTTP